VDSYDGSQSCTEKSPTREFIRTTIAVTPGLIINTAYIHSNYREYYKIKSSADVSEKDEFVANDSLGKTLRVNYL